jgi:hypothetical protein
MNLNHNPTMDQLRELIRPADDRSGGHLLWVRRDGEVVLTALKDRGHPPRFEVKPEMQMCCEPFWVGKGYVGPEAAENEEWIPDLFEVLTTGWIRAKGQPDVVHLERW